MTRSPLRCCISMIWSSALLQASSSLSIGRTRTWPRSLPATEMHFRHFSREFVVNVCDCGKKPLRVILNHHCHAARRRDTLNKIIDCFSRFLSLSLSLSYQRRRLETSSYHLASLATGRTQPLWSESFESLMDKWIVGILIYVLCFKIIMPQRVFICILTVSGVRFVFASHIFFLPVRAVCVFCTSRFHAALIEAKQTWIPLCIVAYKFTGLSVTLIPPHAVQLCKYICDKQKHAHTQTNIYYPPVSADHASIALPLWDLVPGSTRCSMYSQMLILGSEFAQNSSLRHQYYHT